MDWVGDKLILLNIGVGRPVADLIQMFAKDESDWKLSGIVQKQLCSIPDNRTELLKKEPDFSKYTYIYTNIT